MTLKVSADVEFTGPERSALLEATAALERQTAGYLQPRVHFDLDFDDPDSLAAASLHWSLIRLDSSMPLIKQLDEQCDCTILGLTLPEKRHIFLVVDRLQTIQRWRHVVMHEALHAIGLPHVEDPNSLMYRATWPSPTECLHLDDVKAFCDVLHCDVRDLPVCAG